MDLCEVYLRLGPGVFQELVGGISLGRLKTYQMFERLRDRAHLRKLNAEALRKVAPRLWERIGQRDEELATDFAQAVLVCHLDMVAEVLDFLGVPHEGGFFSKDANLREYLKDDWRSRAFEAMRGKHPENLLLFYLNHLAWEALQTEDVYLPAAEGGR